MFLKIRMKDTLIILNPVPYFSFKCASVLMLTTSLFSKQFILKTFKIESISAFVWKQKCVCEVKQF